MSIFDFTPAGALMNAIEAANENDCRNARRVQATPTAATPALLVRAATLTRRVLTAVLDAARGSQSGVTPRSRHV